MYNFLRFMGRLGSGGVVSRSGFRVGVSVILNIHKTAEIILVCLTTAVPVILNWRLTNVLTN